MNIACFDDLLTAARAQPEPQRLLLVLTQAELPDEPTPEVIEAFERGEGGALVPFMSVHKTPDELADFAQFLEETRAVAPNWALVFAAAAGGQNGQAPSAEAAEKLLDGMVEEIKQGQLDAFIPFDNEGQAVRLD
jgi:hypothetical protein